MKKSATTGRDRMQEFKYIVMDGAKNTHTGSALANNADECINRLRDQGFKIVSISPCDMVHNRTEEPIRWKYFIPLVASIATVVIVGMFSKDILPYAIVLAFILAVIANLRIVSRL